MIPNPDTLDAGEPLGLATPGDVLSGDLAAWKARCAQILAERGKHLQAVGEDFVPDRAEVPQMLAEHRRQISAEIWRRELERWPHGDYQHADVRNLLPGQRADAVRAWVADEGARFLLLTGAVGRGKTHLSFALGNYYAALGWRCRAWSEKRYLDALRPSSDPEYPDWQVRKYAQGADFLILDDLGAENTPGEPLSEFVRREMHDLLSARLKGSRRTVISTNLSPRQLAGMYGPRIVSRIHQQATSITITGEDLRVAALPDHW